MVEDSQEVTNVLMVISFGVQFNRVVFVNFSSFREGVPPIAGFF